MRAQGFLVLLLMARPVPLIAQVDSPELNPTALLGSGASPWAGLDGELSKKIAELKHFMLEGLTCTEPNSSRWYTRAGGQLFVGSYDWHSNVIAHWALLTIARLENDRELSALLVQRLSGDALHAERELLAKVDPARRGTYPYDQAWLLMLLRELEHHVPTEDLGEIDALRSETEQALIAWLENQDLPDLAPREEQDLPRFCGFYRSWLFAHLLVVWSEPLTDGAADRLARLRKEKLEPQRDAIERQIDAHPFDFLWVPAILALLDRAGPEIEMDHSYALQEFSALPDAVTLADVHVVGLEISRLWPYAWDSTREIPGTRAAYQSRLKEILARTDLWADDFTVVSHWVPQYLWITLWLALGRP